MPERLSKVKPGGLISVGNNFDTPTQHRPKLALLAMKVVSEWSILEAFLSGLFVQMLGSNPRPGASIFSALTSTAAQLAALRAVAEIALDEEENDVFEAILNLYKSAAKERNKIAHWVWGHVNTLPDAVLLCDPKALIRHSVASVEFSADPQNDKLEFPTPDHDHIYVYVEADFVGVSNRVQQLMTLASFFRIIVAPNHPAYRPALDALLKTPPIQKFVSRRQRGRKTAQEEQSQSPE